MDAKQLRIGNDIKYRNELIKVQSTDILSAELSPSDFSFIPLTEEWLLNFGFECYNKISMVFKKYHNEANSDYSFITLKQVGNPIWDYCAYKQYTNQPLFTEIKYVHQLQNLYFALTGEELKSRIVKTYDEHILGYKFNP